VNNSGICETTPGVHTMSGYVDLSSTMHTVGLSFNHIGWASSVYFLPTVVLVLRGAQCLWDRAFYPLVILLLLSTKRGY
jgi:hypothetical protein